MQIDWYFRFRGSRPDRLPDLVHDRLGGADPVEDDPGRQTELRHPQQFGDRLLRRHAGQWQQHNEAAVRLLVQLARPIVDRADAGGAQLRVLDLMDLFVGAVDELGVDTVAVHVLATILGARGPEDAGLGLLGKAGAGVAVDRTAADTGPADAAPRAFLDDPLPSAVRSLHNPRSVVLEAPRQTLRPQIEGKVHQPAVAVGGDHAKPLFHGDPPVQKSRGQIPRCARIT